MKKFLCCFLSLITLTGCYENNSIEDSIIKIESHEIDLGAENFLESSEQIVDFIEINLESEDVQNLNKQLNDIALSCLDELTYFSLENDSKIEQHWLEVTFFKASYYIKNDILSIVTKKSSYRFESGQSYPEYNIYNLDIVTGEILSNEELLSVYNITVEEVQREINDYFQSNNIVHCSNAEGANPCYFTFDLMVDPVLLVKDDGLNFQLQIHQALQSYLINIPIES